MAALLCRIKRLISLKILGYKNFHKKTRPLRYARNRADELSGVSSYGYGHESLSGRLRPGNAGFCLIRDRAFDVTFGRTGAY
jgi:hypothetical protein